MNYFLSETKISFTMVKFLSAVTNLSPIEKALSLRQVYSNPSPAAPIFNKMFLPFHTGTNHFLDPKVSHLRSYKHILELSRQDLKY